MYCVGRPRRTWLSRSLLALLVLAVPIGLHPVVAQPPAGSGATLAMLDMAFFGRYATYLRSDDSLLAYAATAAMRDYFTRADGVTLADSASTIKATTAPRALAAAEGKPCNVIVACARAVGQELGVRWVVMAKVSKLSDMIWILSGQLIDVSTGKLVYDDVYEVKGVAKDMVPKGAQVFARRVTQRIVAPHP